MSPENPAGGVGLLRHPAAGAAGLSQFGTVESDSWAAGGLRRVAQLAIGVEPVSQFAAGVGPVSQFAAGDWGSSPAPGAGRFGAGVARVSHSDGALAGVPAE